MRKKLPFNVYNSKFFNAVLVGTIAVSGITPTLVTPIQTYAETIDNVNVKISSLPPIDVVLTLGESDLDLTNFKSDLLRELENRGIDRNKVNVQAVDSKMISSNNTDAKEIFNNWENFPYNSSKEFYYYDENEKVITTDYNEPFETGFINKEQGMVDSFKLDTRVYINEPVQPLGYVFGMHPNEQDPSKWDMYYLWISTDFETNESVLALFKVEGQNLDSQTQVKHSNTYSATPLRPYNGTHFGWPDHKPYDYGGFPHGTPQQRGLTVTNVADKNLKTTILDFGKIPMKHGWTQLTLDVNKNRIKASVDGRELINFTDTNNPYDKGYYGIFSYSHRQPKFGDIRSEIRTFKKFNEVIRQPEWRENSERFIVNVDNRILPEFEDPQDSGELLTRLINEEIDYVAFGTSSNKSQAEKIIEQNNGEGKFIDSSNYNQAIKQLADYIEEEIKISQQEMNDQYLLVGEQLNIEVSPSHLQENTQTSKYPQGRWRVDHDYEYFENNMGQYALSGQYQPNLDFVFDKSGRYELWFEDKHPDPRYIYVHRRPVANFSLSLSDKGNSFQVQIQDMSYDLDQLSNSDKGIAEYEWKWKETTATKWNNGMIPSYLPKGKNYIIQLRVKDHQGVWSEPEARYITTANVATVPIANFNMPSNATKYENVEIANLSYDPAGKDITDSQWTIEKDGKQVYSGKNPVANFGAYGEGVYKVTLKVKNSTGLWSEEFSRFITITADNINPEAIINPVRVEDTQENITVTATFSDKGGSGFDSQRFAITNSATVPSSGWSEWSMDTVRKITLNQEGKFYIHFQARDKEGNQVTRTVGEYIIDRTKPANATFSPSTTSWTNQDVSVTINYPNDSVVREYRVDGGIWQTYSMPVVVSKNSKIEARSYDKAGNVSEVSSFNVNNIDKVNPTPSSISYVGVKNTVTVTSGKDNESGVKEVRVKIDNGNWDVYTSTLVLTDGEYDIYVKTIDRVGNESEVTSKKVILYKERYEKALDAVNQADETKSQEDIDKARELIDLLPDEAPEKKVMEDDIEVVQKEHDLIELINDTIGDPSDLEDNLDLIYEKIKEITDPDLIEELKEKIKEIEEYLKKKEEFEDIFDDAKESLSDEDVAKLLELYEQLNEHDQARYKPDIDELLKNRAELRLNLEAILATQKAEKTRKVADLEYAKEKVDALPMGTLKTDLENRLYKLERSLNFEFNQQDLEKQAEEAVEKAEITKTQEDINEAKKLVYKLISSTKKTELLSRINILENELKEGKKELSPEQVARLEGKAKEAVKWANTLRTNSALETALDLIYLLPDGDTKETLLNEVRDLQEEIQQEKDAMLSAMELVEQAEFSNNPEHYKIAKEAVNSLASPDLKLELMQRLNLVQYGIEMFVVDPAQLVEKAEGELKKAEILKRNPYIDRARAIIRVLPENEPKKIEYQKRINSLVEGIEEQRFNSLIEKAEKRIDMAEKTKSSVILKKALDAIMAVPDSDEKLRLLQQYDAITGIPSVEVETNKELLALAERWVNEAETSPSVFALQHAQEKINKLPSKLSTQKVELQKRLDMAYDNYYAEQAINYVSKANKYHSSFFISKGKEIAEKIKDADKKQTVLNKIKTVEAFYQ